MSDDVEIISQMRRVFMAKKKLVQIPGWQEVQHKSTIKLEFVASVEIDSVTLEGVRLRGRTLKTSPESDLTFQLEMRYGSFWHHLCRLDWRPKGGHTDQVGPIADRTNFTGSGWHSFDNNAGYGLWTLREGNLPRAVPLNPDPTNFNDVLIEIERKMLVENARDIPGPDWDTQGRLL